MNNEERRRFPRHTKSFYVAAQVLEDEFIKDDQAFGLLVELSQGGCLLNLPKDTGKGVSITVRIGFGEHIEEFQGTTAHIRETEKGWLTGVEFDPLDERRRLLLDQVLHGVDVSPLGEWFHGREG
jgi:hypothetical protein